MTPEGLAQRTKLYIEQWPKITLFYWEEEPINLHGNRKNADVNFPEAVISG